MRAVAEEAGFAIGTLYWKDQHFDQARQYPGGRVVV